MCRVAETQSIRAYYSLFTSLLFTNTETLPGVMVYLIPGSPKIKWFVPCFLKSNSLFPVFHVPLMF